MGFLILSHSGTSPFYMSEVLFSLTPAILAKEL